jgi:hypothetical protein
MHPFHYFPRDPSVSIDPFWIHPFSTFRPSVFLKGSIRLPLIRFGSSVTTFWLHPSVSLFPQNGSIRFAIDPFWIHPFSTFWLLISVHYFPKGSIRLRLIPFWIHRFQPSDYIHPFSLYFPRDPSVLLIRFFGSIRFNLLASSINFSLKTKKVINHFGVAKCHLWVMYGLGVSYFWFHLVEA